MMLMVEEIFDIVDEHDKVIGQATRKECHSNPDIIHRAAYILIFNKEGKILLQKRSAKKDTGKNKWDISCAGHNNPGESYERAAKRELKEELGLSLPLKYAGKLLIRIPRESEYNAIFTAVIGKQNIMIDKNEVQEVRFFSMEEIKKLSDKEVTEMFWHVMDFY